ncbi:MAG TPA: hypothetical protein ACFYD6_11670 [Candidatus Brocadiia bacterium]|nr:hypothetical protein [Planctomycetota bacterium]MDO8092310.1 hypothetical protein [Candidatus Brocadiales bacterium]
MYKSTNAAVLMDEISSESEVSIHSGATISEAPIGAEHNIIFTCIFKNPPGYYAGALIEQAGLKGQRVGGAMVSEEYANFIIDTGNATVTDVLELVDMVRCAVLRKFNILLELEIQVW